MACVSYKFMASDEGKLIKKFVGFEVFTAMIMKNVVFWVVAVWFL
jgi:hypothetical protein